jgi:hypothetical protein
VKINTSEVVEEVTNYPLWARFVPSSVFWYGHAHDEFAGSINSKTLDKFVAENEASFVTAAENARLVIDGSKVKIVKGNEEGKRKGQQTTGMVAQAGNRQIVLYMSGSSHAGENVSEVLKKRQMGQSGPIRMGDGLAANRSPEVAGVIEACCLAHARRKFVEIEASFPQECGKVLDIIGKIYRTEAETVGKSEAERLAQHQRESQPRLEELKSWMVEEQAQGRVEPNSSLGQAFGYLQGKWANLTRFVEVAGVPLDNNVAERVLKRVVLHRKNAYFFRNEHGADRSSFL